MQRRRNEQGAVWWWRAGGGWWAVAPGHVLLSVLSVLSCTMAVDTSNLAIAVSPFLGPRPSRRKSGLLDLNSVAPKLGSRGGGRRRRSRARVLHTMANCRPGRQGLSSATGPSLKFLWRKTLEPIDGCFHFGCARKMDRLGQPSRASVMDDMDERSKRDHAGPRFPAANAWLGSDPVRLQMSGPGKWGLSCFEMTGDGGCTLGGMRWNRSGARVGSGHQSREQSGGNPKVGCWRRGDDGGGVRRMGEGGRGAGWGKRT